jgi:hypothetical protein
MFTTRDGILKIIIIVWKSGLHLHLNIGIPPFGFGLIFGQRSQWIISMDHQSLVLYLIEGWKMMISRISCCLFQISLAKLIWNSIASVKLILRDLAAQSESSRCYPLNKLITDITCEASAQLECTHRKIDRLSTTN